MHHRHRAAVNRFLQLLGFVVVSAALAVPAAHAQERKKAPVKKQQTSAASASPKRAAAPRKAATATKPVRVSAKSSKAATRVAFVPAKPSFGQMAGLHEVNDPLDLKSSVALVIDQDTHEVLLSKNDHAVLPIASLTKLMTGMIISQAKLPMEEPITITQDDVDTEKGSRSRLVVGATLTRGEMLHLALMSSENRAAHALGRTYPGGLEVFVAQMNAKAKLLGMTDTRYVEPTGLSSRNQSSARDLATLVNVAHGDPLLRELSTSPGYEVAVGQRTLQYNNTNGLVKNPTWDIGLQKTGYISEAGRCLVMQTQIAGRKLIMVFLDSAGKFSRLGDAERVRHWVETLPASLTTPLQARASTATVAR
ncbi:D-alanyl-D-alanine endopeptidase [Acidovorax sp. sic0104]|uniref:D-alanyl-D-alanine endopeptidase n=1 Tax=Acidovorax sp. sic0104 TaxID=2854784 RepID=UPI001C44A7D4|nr:D-alanyl-D-alanine endopeptidase [Acidovorax sp. sic0104]MBV7541048.1 D-alanyl-D-alanine endopeptidase [Acidovorax sp. sic0104]